MSKFKKGDIVAVCNSESEGYKIRVFYEQKDEGLYTYDECGNYYKNLSRWNLCIPIDRVSEFSMDNTKNEEDA